MSTTSTLTNANAVGDVADQAHQVVDRATERAVPALQRAASAAHGTIDKAATVAATAADWVAQSEKQIAAQSSQVADACSGYVRARPFVSVIGALAIGYLAGKMMR
ncbi:MAG: hypothetical protein ABI569_03215 [Casimicrobiaceae bacterium]